MKKKPSLILASSSPRRLQLLREAGFSFVVQKPDIEEIVKPGESGRAMVLRLARQKAKVIKNNHAVILSADTTVVIGHEILNKPESPAHAARMLKKISGKKHVVYTAICLRSEKKQILKVYTTEVWLSPLSASFIQQYVATGEPLDKAGAYAAQGIGMSFVQKIRGSYSNVIGLPIAEVRAILQKEFNIFPELSHRG